MNSRLTYSNIVQSIVPKNFKRKILIDCGFHKGLYTKAFLQKNHDFIVYAFDPIKIEPILPNVNFINKAVWIEDCVRKIYLSHRDDASSLISTVAVDVKKSIDIECINFNKWINDNFTSDDYIHVKLDIEGAEYQVLHNMINGGSIKLISELVCEWHSKICSRQYRQIMYITDDLFMEKLKTFDNIKLLSKWI
jgi:FkbM family methyltransferase